jgi:hypothetical protein
MATKVLELLVLKNGKSINGTVKTDPFTLKTDYGDLKLRKKNILSIEYKNPPYMLQDEVQVSAGTRVGGELLPATIRIELEDTGQIISIPKSDILSIVLFTGRSRNISTATTRKLKAIA